MLVVAKRLPFAFVGVREDHAIEGNRSEPFGAFVIAFLRGREQRVQHLDRRLEHFHEFQHALVGQA